MKEEQANAMLCIIGSFIGVVIILEILPWLIVCAIEFAETMVEEFKRLGREKKL